MQHFITGNLPTGSEIAGQLRRHAGRDGLNAIIVDLNTSGAL